ncbi:hypothetical protein ACN3XK_54655 [Actinomadura welshii]
MKSSAFAKPGPGRHLPTTGPLVLRVAVTVAAEAEAKGRARA